MNKRMLILFTGAILLLCLIGLFVAGRLFWSVQEKEPAHSRGEMVPV